MGLLEELAALADRGKRNVAGGLLDPQLFATRVGENVREWGRGLLSSDRKSVVPEVRKAGQQAQIEAALPFFGGGIAKAGKATKKELTQYQKAHAEAQRNAALPVEQGGLGLPPDNTAMDRARAMGFDTRPSKQQYHGARGEVDGPIDPSRSDFGFHTGSLDQAEARLRAFGDGGVNFGEGANVMPLVMSRYANMLPVKDMGSFHADALAPQLEKKRILAKGKSKPIVNAVEGDWKKAQQYDEQMRAAVEQAGYDGLRYSNAQEGSGASYAFSNPSMLRSRFAAFDPKKRGSSDLLASLGLLGLLGGGIYGSEQ